MGDEADDVPAVELVRFDPVTRSGFPLGSPFGPEVLQGVGHTPQYSQHRHGIVIPDPALILPIGHVQGVMGPVFYAPVLLVKGQPLLRILLCRGAGGDLPGPVKFAFGANAPVNPGQLHRAGQPQLLGFDNTGHNRPVFFASAPVSGLLQYRGEVPPAGIAGRF